MTLEYLELMEDMKKQQQQEALPVPRKVRGTLTIKSEDDMEFRAERSTGQAAQKVIKKSGQSKLYDTVGDKQSKRVVHLVTESDNPDCVGTFYSQLEELTAGMEPEEKQRRWDKRSQRVLANDADLFVAANKKEKSIRVTMTINVATTPNYNTQLINLMQRTSQCFAINQTSLALLRK